MEPAGKYSERVTIQRPHPPTNDGGVPVPVAPSVVYGRIPASVRGATPGLMERVFASQVQATATHVVALRRRAVPLTDEIVWHDVINGVVNDRVLKVTGRADDKDTNEVILAVVEQIR